MQCWLTPKQPQTKTKNKQNKKTVRIYSIITIWPNREWNKLLLCYIFFTYTKHKTQSIWHSFSAGKEEHCKNNKAASSLPCLVSLCTPALLHRHTEGAYLQCAVFSPLQELNKTLHHPCSGDDFIDGWVRFCVRHGQYNKGNIALRITEVPSYIYLLQYLLEHLDWNDKTFMLWIKWIGAAVFKNTVAEETAYVTD